MKVRASLAAVAALGMVVAVGSPAGAAAKATAKVMMTGDCFDGQMLEGTDEDDCQIMVSITPKNKNTSAVLEVAYDEEDPEWEEFDSGKTRGGRLIFDIPSTDEDDVWMDGVVLYRVIVKKTAGLSVAKPKTYKIEYVSAENVDEEDTQMTDDEKAEAAEMDKAQADNQRNIQQQQPNANVQSDKSMQGPPQNFNKAGEFNRACGAIGFPKDKCDQLVAVKSPKEALTILGSQSEKWCTALVNSKEMKVTCDMVLPKVFPPING